MYIYMASGIIVTDATVRTNYSDDEAGILESSAVTASILQLDEFLGYLIT